MKRRRQRGWVDLPDSKCFAGATDWTQREITSRRWVEWSPHRMPCRALGHRDRDTHVLRGTHKELQRIPDESVNSTAAMVPNCTATSMAMVPLEVHLNSLGPGEECVGGWSGPWVGGSRVRASMAEGRRVRVLIGLANVGHDRGVCM